MSEPCIPYMNSGLYEEVEAYLEGHLKPGRLAHTHRVIQMAEKLALIHGVDANRAMLAAHLHDMAKYLHVDAIMPMLKEAHIDDPYLYKVPELAHGELGAILAQRLFGIEDADVLNAVRFHTYGRRGMSSLEQIIFLADYIELGRHFEGVDQCRALAYKNLDEAMYYASSLSIRYLLERGSVVHPSAIEIYNEWLENKEIL